MSPAGDPPERGGLRRGGAESGVSLPGPQHPAAVAAGGGRRPARERGRGAERIAGGGREVQRPPAPAAARLVLCFVEKSRLYSGTIKNGVLLFGPFYLSFSSSWFCQGNTLAFHQPFYVAFGRWAGFWFRAILVWGFLAETYISVRVCRKSCCNMVFQAKTKGRLGFYYTSC